MMRPKFFKDVNGGSTSGSSSASSIPPLNTPTTVMSVSTKSEQSVDTVEANVGGKPHLSRTNVTSKHADPSEDKDKRNSTCNDNNNKEGSSRHMHRQLAQPTNPRKINGYIGFANLPNQIYRQAVKKGFDFTLMVVGESGLGKSTLINSMFLADIYNDQYPGPSLRVKKTVSVETKKFLLKENGVNLRLAIVDTPGFGDAVDNSNCWVPIIEHIESKYDEFLNAESSAIRHQISDNRVHCCLYFIGPSGHGLKPLDVEFMKRLHDKVNIVPVIAKADTMTVDECAYFKKQILNEITKHKIKIYSFPDVEEEEEKKLHKILMKKVPFAVIGADTIVEHNGKKIRGRKYPWGVVEVDNHSDFQALRNMVIRTHLQDLKDVTNDVYYENFRCRILANLRIDGKLTRIVNKNPLVQFEEEKREHENKMKVMKTEMEQVFEMKVREKKQKLKETTINFQRKHKEMRQSLEEEIRELDEKRRAFEAEKSKWEQTTTRFSIDESNRSLETHSKVTGFVSSVSSTDGEDASKGSSRGLGNLLRRHNSSKSLQDNITQLQPVIQYQKHF